MAKANENHEKRIISKKDCIMCKVCQEIFCLKTDNDKFINDVTFPNNDFSVINAKCPRCDVWSKYRYVQLLSNEKYVQMVKDLKNRIKESRAEFVNNEEKLKEILQIQNSR